jgi:hypothetical protein
VKNLLAIISLGLCAAVSSPAHGQYSSAPRIIQIPQNEQTQHAYPLRVAPRRAAAPGDAGDLAPAAALHPDVVAPRRPRFERRRAFAPSPLPEPSSSGPKRAVLTAPSLPVEGPSPVRPLPRRRDIGKGVAAESRAASEIPQTAGSAPREDTAGPIQK